MKKALYLFLVSLMSTFIFVALSSNGFTHWTKLSYFIFSCLYSVFIWFLPNRKMLKLTAAMPILFLIVLLLVFSTAVGVSKGYEAGFHYLGGNYFVMLMPALIFLVCQIFVVYILFAIFIYKRIFPRESDFILYNIKKPVIGKPNIWKPDPNE